MNFDDYEQLPTPSTSTNMIAGAAAGILEHCVMYPMDSIKVRFLFHTYVFKVYSEMKIIHSIQHTIWTHNLKHRNFKF